MKVIGIGGIEVCCRSNETMKTFGLGSCVALVLLDSIEMCVGMAHVALPDSSFNPEKAAKLPGYFADTAVPELVDRMVLGRIRQNEIGRRLQARIAGGASINDSTNVFQIGRRNVLAIQKRLEFYGILLKPEHMDIGGGNLSRTVSVTINTGQVMVSYATDQAVRKL